MVPTSLRPSALAAIDLPGCCHRGMPAALNLVRKSNSTEDMEEKDLHVLKLKLNLPGIAEYPQGSVASCGVPWGPTKRILHWKPTGRTSAWCQQVYPGGDRSLKCWNRGGISQTHAFT